MEDSLHHHGTTMGGRDPHEPHRAATPLELLFDLTFVIAFGASANELAHALAEGHIATGVIGFAFATFAVSWAWINFAWFASAYDTDDWIFRLTTMVQMVGVLILALGLPALFESLQDGDHLDTRVMVIGYVVMRVAMVFQWLRASRQDPGRSHVCRTYVATIVVSQVLWVAWMLAELPIATTFAVAAVPVLIELSGPVIAERRGGGTPWHPHHIAERHGLVIIIALGEGLIGTMGTRVRSSRHSEPGQGGYLWRGFLVAAAGRWEGAPESRRRSIILPLIRVLRSASQAPAGSFSGSSTREWSIRMLMWPKSLRARPPSLAIAPTIWRGSTLCRLPTAMR